MRNEIPNKYFCDCKYPIAIVFKSLILEKYGNNRVSRVLFNRLMHVEIIRWHVTKNPKSFDDIKIAKIK